MLNTGRRKLLGGQHVPITRIITPKKGGLAILDFQVFHILLCIKYFDIFNPCRN